MKIKIDNQVVRMDILDKKSSINKQGIMVLANIMQESINGILDKRNKQQSQNLSEQFKDFKNDMMEKFNILTFA